MENLFSIPMNLDFATSLIICFFAVLGIIFFRSKKDKFLMVAAILLQLVFVGVLAGLIKHFPNLLRIVGLITMGDVLVFLFVKDDRQFPYFSLMIHFATIFQVLYLFNIILGK